MKPCAFILCLFSVLMLSGCANSKGRVPAEREIAATAVYGSLNGERLGETPGASWIDDNRDFLSCMDRIRPLRLGGEEQEVPPEVDYENEGLLIIWMGRMPTSGYGIELAQESAYIRDHTAFVTVKWTEPAPDAVLSQRITAPCLMIRMMRGDYSRIRVIDENGTLRAETGVDRGEQ